jgi:hypothetical protein
MQLISKLNKIDKTGKIYNTNNNDVISYTVSPFDNNFLSQIELYMQPIITELISKNYLPVSCCQGHGNYKRERAYFTVAFPNKESAEKYAKNFNKSFFSEVIVSSLENWCQVEKEKIEKDPHIDHSDLGFKESVELYNKLFLRNYKEYYFVKVIYERSLILDNIFVKRWYKKVQQIIKKDLEYFMY